MPRSKKEVVKKLEELILFLKPDFTYVSLSEDEKRVIAGGKGFRYNIGIECNSDCAIIKQVVDAIIYK